MDPISLGIMAVGLGMSVFGGIGSSGASAKAAEISKDEAMHEQQINSIKQQQMDVEARRTNLQTIRNNQQARAMATEAATNQGAQFGSGLQGGLAQIQDQTLYNMQGVNYAQAFGKQIFAQNNAISADKMQMAGVQSDQAQYAGISSIGGAIMKAGPLIGGLSKGFGSMNLGSPFMGGGSPSGYGA